MNRAAFYACILLLATGCAPMLNKRDPAATINSDPPGAIVFVEGVERGTTPMTYTWEERDGLDVEMELRKAGYHTSTLRFRCDDHDGVLLADALLLHIPYLVDRKSPRMRKLGFQEVTVPLYLEPRQDQRTFLVPVAPMDVDLTDTDLGTADGKPLDDGRDGPFRDLGGESSSAGTIVGALKGTWIDARTYYKGSSKGAELLQQGKVLLRPVLRDLDATFTEKRGRYSGPLDASIDWVFLSGMRQDSVLHTVPMRTRLDLVTTHRTEVMTELLRHAARRLAEDPDLPAVLAGIHKEAVLAGRGEAISVKTPAPLAFEGRKDMLSTLVKAVTTIQTSDGHGSGFLITNDGYIITNEHVVEKDPVVKVRFEQGFTLDGRVVKVNRDLDLALVKVDATDLPALSIGDDTGLLLGEELFAIGTPLDVSLGQSVSRGILSGTREIEDRRLLQTDVSINPGNSGGPLVDENGKVVGVATLKLSGEGLEGLGFAVPISVALDMLNLQFAP